MTVSLRLSNRSWNSPLEISSSTGTLLRVAWEQGQIFSCFLAKARADVPRLPRYAQQRAGGAGEFGGPSTRRRRKTRGDARDTSGGGGDGGGATQRSSGTS